MQNSWSYLKDPGDFLKKMKNISSIPEDTILVTTDLVSLYPSIPHTAGDRDRDKVCPSIRLYFYG